MTCPLLKFEHPPSLRTDDWGVLTTIEYRTGFERVGVDFAAPWLTTQQRSKKLFEIRIRQI
jgi:hypothetical protein